MRQAAQRGSCGRVAPLTPSSHTSTTSPGRPPRSEFGRWDARAYLATLVSASDQVVRGRFDRLGQPAVWHRVDRDRQGRPPGEHPDRARAGRDRRGPPDAGHGRGCASASMSKTTSQLRPIERDEREALVRPWGIGISPTHLTSAPLPRRNSRDDVPTPRHRGDQGTDQGLAGAMGRRDEQACCVISQSP
jgi:hypothetical protein